MRATPTQSILRLWYAATLLLVGGCHEQGAVESSNLDDAETAEQRPTVSATPPKFNPAWVTIGGTGCAPRAATLYPYGHGFDLRFGSFQVTSGGSMQSEKSCSVLVRPPATPGWEYSLHRVAMLNEATLSSRSSVYEGRLRFGFVDETDFTDWAVGGQTTGPTPSKGAQFVSGGGGNANPRWSGCGVARPWMTKLSAVTRGPQPAGGKVLKAMIDLTWRRCGAG